MKIVFKSTIGVLVLAAALFSCKNNKDGYSDEIETVVVPDSTQKPVDSTGTNETGTNKTTGTPNTGAASTTPDADLGKKGTADGGTGTGTGPGEDAEDGSTYTSSSKKQNIDKDSVRIKPKK
ncbi:hypothetical protein ASE21_11305 [Flavobacterium sp. Root901]|uniref:hypothetical protein n=1 Tax=Flavobacterium sp. Root901 TaxID=1736605 RepID=UPI00070EECDE|nr:hypothetical protein [Flavobacterium sp. Root901]KRD10294.1 hypothetical protein ASE21_11305 [Flavobacterium sp. Root901]